jgi:hypothetical protein
MQEKTVPAFVDQIWNQYGQQKSAWLNSIETKASPAQSFSSLPATNALSRQIHSCLLEQDRLKNQFSGEVCRTLAYVVTRSINDSAVETSNVGDRLAACVGPCVADVADIIAMYSQVADDLKGRQLLELDCAANFDTLHSRATAPLQGSGTHSRQLLENAREYFSKFRYEAMFSSAVEFSQSVSHLLSSVRQL